MLDDHMWYSMNKKPFVEETNVHAILSILHNPVYWRERIENILGYLPYAELFANPPDLSAEEHIYDLFEGDKKEEHYKMFLEGVSFIDIVRKLLKRNMPHDQISEVTGLTIEEVKNIYAKGYTGSYKITIHTPTS